MKENVMDLLMFLFDNYLNMEDGIPEDELALAFELEEAGFQAKEITQAFAWLGELADIEGVDFCVMKTPSKGLRIYTHIEQQKLDVESRGFLVGLEEMGLLDTVTREIIIDRAMAIEIEHLSVQQFKKIVGLVLLNRAPKEEILPWIEDMIYDETNVFH